MSDFDWNDAPGRSWLRLALLLTVPLATFGAAYALWKVHWLAGVIGAVPIWILLTDLLVNKRDSLLWYLADFVRHLIIFGASALSIWLLWRIDWRLGAIAGLPLFVLWLNLIGFLMSPVYGLTREAERERTGLQFLDSLAKRAQDGPADTEEGDGDNQ